MYETYLLWQVWGVRPVAWCGTGGLVLLRSMSCEEARVRHVSDRVSQRNQKECEKASFHVHMV